MKRDNTHCIFETFQQPTHLRQLFIGKRFNPLAKFRIKLSFYPRHIDAMLSNAGFHACKAYFKRIIKKKYSITVPEPIFHCRKIIAVNDPSILPYNIFQCGLKFLLRNRRFIRFVPKIV